MKKAGISNEIAVITGNQNEQSSRDCSEEDQHEHTCVCRQLSTIISYKLPETTFSVNS